MKLIMTISFEQLSFTGRTTPLWMSVMLLSSKPDRCLNGIRCGRLMRSNWLRHFRRMRHELPLACRHSRFFPPPTVYCSPPTPKVCRLIIHSSIRSLFRPHPQPLSRALGGCPLGVVAAAADGVRVNVCSYFMLHFPERGRLPCVICARGCGTGFFARGRLTIRAMSAFVMPYSRKTWASSSASRRAILAS